MTNVDASTLYPARVPGERLLHYGRQEARRKAGPVLLAVCTSVTGEKRELERAPVRRWWQWRRRRWCPACTAYRSYLEAAPRR